jgi:hypothetical protein
MKVLQELAERSEEPLFQTLHKSIDLSVLYEYDNFVISLSLVNSDT